MASTIETQNTQRYVDFDEYIEYQLQKTRGNIKTTDILTAFAFIAVFVLAYLLLFVICDHWLLAEGFGQTARVVLISLVGFVSAAWLTWKVIWPYLRQVNRLFAAKIIEQSQPELRSTLLNLIDARAAGQNVSPQILSVMEKRAAISMSQTNVDEAVDRRPLLRACYAVLALVVLFCIYTLFTPKKVSTSLWRALFPTAAVAAPTQTVIDNVTPGDAEVIPGTRLEVLADIKGAVPEHVILHYSTADQEFVDEPMEMRPVSDMPGRYRAEIIGANGEGIQQHLAYSITAGDDRSATYHVKVFQPPAAEIVELQYNYPDYMGRKPKTRQSGNIDDYEGVTVTFIVQGNMPLKSAVITFHDDQGTDFQAEALPMSALNSERTRFRASWVLTISPEDGIYPRYYTIECKNERGESDPNPARWPIRIHPDQRPEVRIANPAESELERPANAILPLTAAARDDFKVQSLTLWKQLNDNPPIKHGSLFRGAEASVSVDYDWPLAEGWELKTGDRVSYWVEAHDNRTPEPGKRNSDKHAIVIQPEQPEEIIQQQLESDRRPQEEKSEAPKENPQQTPQNAKERPQDAEPMPQEGQQEGQPQQTQEGQPGEEGEPKGGGESTKPGEGQSDSKQTKSGGESVNNDGSQDGKALESLHRHINRNETEPNPPSENQPPDNNPSEKNEDPAGQNKGQDPSTSQPNDKSGEKNTDPAAGEKNTDPTAADKMEETQKPSDPQQPMTGENPSKPAREMDPQNAEPNQTSPPNAPEKTEKPAESPDSETPKKPQEKTNEGAGTDQTGKAESPQSTQNQKQKEKTDPMRPEDRQAKGGSDGNTSEGQPGNSAKPAGQDNGKAPAEKTQPGDGDPGRPAEKPLEGREKPAAPDDSAQKREATGEEKGPATAQDDPGANPKQAKNPLDRTDPEKPTATQNREGPAEQDPSNKRPGKTDRENTQPAGSKPSDQDPGMTDPSKNADGPRPDQTPQPEQGTNNKKTDRKPATPQDQPNAADEKPKGAGRPEGQQAEKPEGGEAGSSEKNQDGTPGSNEKGPGEKTPRPGNADPAQKPEKGRPGEKTGEGSQTRPTEKTEEVPRSEERPQNGQPAPDTQKSEEGTGQTGNRGADAQPAQETPHEATGDAGTADFGKSRPSQGQPTPSSAEAAEKANLEYGRQAADLALKRLEDQLRRGDINEDWLKEMGWDKADATQFLDRMKDRLNRDDSSPESLAQQRQFNEWLKRLKNAGPKTTRRSGSAVRNRSARDLFNAKNSTPPAELRDIYEAYQRGISERSK